MPKTTLSFYLRVIAVAVVVFAVGNWLSSRTPDRAEGSPSIISGDSSATPRNDNRESVFDRVMRTKTIRCGYATWYPNLTIDPNTGQKSGISYDVMNRIGQVLDLKIEWTQEAGFGAAEQDLLSGRYDALCADVCFEAKRTKFINFSRPFIQSPLYLIGRHDDARFDQNLALANTSDVTVGILRNTILDHWAQAYFPNAKQIDISELGAETDLMMAIGAKKADVSFNNQISVDRYSAKNPNIIRTIGAPIGMCYSGFMLPHGDEKFKYMIDSAINELIFQGEMPTIFTKYLPNDNRYWQVPKTDYAPQNAQK